MVTSTGVQANCSMVDVLADGFLDWRIFFTEVVLAPATTLQTTQTKYLSNSSFSQNQKLTIMRAAATIAHAYWENNKMGIIETTKSSQNYSG